MRVKVRMTASFLLCVALATSYVVTGNGFHMFETKSAHSCLNDGYSNGTDACECKDPNYISGVNCEIWKCINFGKSIARPDSGNQFLKGCDCPPGFRGLHCEPTACIPNSDGFIRAFNPVENIFSIIITYNQRFIDVINRGDTIIDSITEMLQGAPFNTSAIDSLHVHLIGGSVYPLDCPSSTSDPLAISKCFKQEMSDYVNYFGPFNDTTLTTSILLSQVQAASTYSSVLLVTNIGISDNDNSQQINLIAQSAVARQIELNVIIVEPIDTQGRNIFFSPRYIPLIDLVHKTLGTFIVPYQINGGPNGLPIKDIIPKFGKIIATKTLVDFGTWNGSTLSSRFNVLSVNDKRDIYISVAANSPVSTNISVVLQSAAEAFAPFTLELDAGIWKLFKFPYDKTLNGYQVFYQVSEACTYHIWTVSQLDTAAAPPHTFIGFRTDTVSDANYPIAVKGTGSVPIPNTVVAHIYNAGADLQKNIGAAILLGDGSTISTNVTAPGMSRNCLFSLEFTSVTCGTDKDYGTIQIKIDDLSYFQETIPIICGTPSDTQVAAEVASFKVVEDSLDDVPVSEDVYTCTATVDIPLDPTAPKTFVLAFPNYNSLIGPLFSGLLDKKPIIKLLRDYYNSYNPDYFNNFVLAPYTVNDAGTTAPNVKLSTTYDDFQQTFIDAYGNTTMTEPSPGALDQGFVINSLVNFAQIAPYSEIFIITNKLYNTTGNTNTDIYKSLANKRIKLNFLIYDDGTFQGFNDITLLSNFYDFAARSGGNVIPCDDVKAIEHFFDNYQGLQISQNSISSFDGSKEFAGIQSAGEFNYQTGKSYYIAATIKYASDGSPTFPWVQLQGKISTIQLNATVIIGRFYAKFLIPTSTPTDKYTVNILSGDLAPVFFVNVLEINPDHFYVIGFASEPTFDIQYTYPSYSGTGSRVYIVANAPDHDYSDVTIRYPYNKEFYTGEADERTNCKYNLITSNYTWQCSIPNQLYYITFDTSDRTHTEMFPCVSNGGSDTGNCQNGGQPDGNGNCVCPPGFMGPNCGDPVCYNGGTIQIDNTCRCSDYYTGEHCENALFSCQKDIPFPRFTSLLETFVLVVDLNLAPLPSIKPEDIPSVFQQYILVSAYQANGQDEALVQVYNNAQYFFTALSNLKPNSYPKDSRFAIRRALQAVKSDRSLVVWLSGATVLCGVDDDNPQPDDELLNLIAKRRVELRAFTKTQESACHRMISSYGNGVPLTYRNLENVFKYVNLLVPPTISDPDKANNNLVVVDSYITDDCQNIDVMLAIEKTQALPQYTNLHIILSNLEPAVGSTLTEIVTDLYDLQLTTDFTLKPQTPNTFCGYIVEALHPSRVAYEVTPSDNFEAEGYGVFYLAETTNLNIYFENGIEDDNFNNFPEVFTANVEYTNFTYEHAPVIRRQCTYPWSIEIMCDGFSGALKTKLIIKDSEKNSHQRLLTTYCIKKMTCSSYGRKLLTDDKDDDYGISQKVWTCGCSPLWYGTDCSIPICLNGGTPNRETCLCPNNYYGSNCEYQLLSSLFNYRLILIIYDVTGNDDQLESKKELVTEFINMYSQNNTNYYAFTTNVAGGPKVNVTNSASLILDAINAAVVSNKSIDLGQAFDFFNGQNLQVSLFQINGMFYITDSSVDPEQDFTTLFELQTKGFYLYSAYYYNNTDPSIPRLSDLSGLGGTTGAWNIYDILSDFSKFLHGGDLSVVPTPPITTTARPIPCVYNEIMDFTFFFDPVVSSTNYFGIFIYMRQFLIDLSSDLKFATVSEPDGSRAAFGVVNQSSGNLLCLSSAETLKDGATNVPFIKLLGNNNVNLSDVLRQANALMGPNARDHRNVPKFAVIITDRPIIDNLNEIVASAQKIKNETKIHFVVIGLGTGDFKSTYGKFAEQGMLYTIPDALEATQNAFKNKFYKDVCQVSNNLGHGDTSYDCQISKKSWPNLWI